MISCMLEERQIQRVFIFLTAEAEISVPCLSEVGNKLHL